MVILILLSKIAVRRALGRVEWGGRVMNRPDGWTANPQAMAAVSKRAVFGGNPLLMHEHEPDPDTWLTPRYILDQLGDFDLDPCAAVQNPTWAARRFIVKEFDGLHAEWHGRVFMNPPFSNTAAWLRRHAEYGRGISLVPATVESEAWRQCVWTGARAILLLHGRTRFCNPDGSSTQGRPLRSVALIGWDRLEVEVLKRCQLAGTLLTAWGIHPAEPLSVPFASEAGGQIVQP